MSAPRRSARIAAMNAPSTPVKSRSKPETPSAPKKVTTRTPRPANVTPIKLAPKVVPTAPVADRHGWNKPEFVAAREAAEALYPLGSKEYYDELEKCPALQEYRASSWNSLSGSISAGW